MAAMINLEPRYTPGSPGAVSDEALARQVARDERECYEHALEGVYGEADKKKAEEQGLALIVFLMWETSKGWRVEDYITGEKHFWPFTATCPECDTKRVDVRRGKLQPHYRKGSSYACERGAGKYVGRLRTPENP